MSNITLEDILPAVEPRSGNESRRVVVAGPCSAESRAQTLEAAKGLAEVGIDLFRAGLWKPRTRPGGFEGCGSLGLEWLREVKERTGLEVATEVATSRHVERALGAGVDVLWVGARTTTNPFAVQAIADALKGTGARIMVKNPANPDLELWIGAIQRFYIAGIRRISAVHRGFSVYGPTAYRNPPQWEIPIELHRRYPTLQIICDPSHIGGKRELIEPLANHACELGFDGLIVETHCHPECALSDAAQQITPQRLAEILHRLGKNCSGSVSDMLEERRGRIDMIDNEIMHLLAQRMTVCDEIGALKKDHNLPVFQAERYQTLMDSRVGFGESLGLSREFISKILSAIHAESVNRQLKLKS